MGSSVDIVGLFRELGPYIAFLIVFLMYYKITIKIDIEPRE